MKEKPVTPTEDRILGILEKISVRMDSFSARMAEIDAARDADLKASKAAFKLENAKREADLKAENAKREAALKAENAKREADLKASKAEWEEIKAIQNKISKNLKKAEDMFVGQWGKLMESLVEGGLIKLLNDQGIEVHSSFTNYKPKYKGQEFEFDIVSVNNKELVVTEVKTTLRVGDVNYFIKKLDQFTDFAPQYKGHKVYGAVAYLKANQAADRYAEKKGLFVIKAGGGGVSKVTNKPNFKPKVFCS